MMQLYTFQFTAGKDTEFLIILEGNRDARLLVLHDIESVSYTHLTLPTIYSV